MIDLVDPEPVAISDNKLIFKLNKTKDDTSKTEMSDQVLKSELIPVATSGVFAEAVQGRANSAEKLDISRFWNWQDSPIPIVAPEIAAIQAGSRATSADVRPGSLDASNISQMQPHTLPEPGAGTAAILNAISSEMFRDMSGIMQTAQLAQSALEQAQQGATAAGGQSSENLKNGLDLTKDVVGKIIKMNSDYAQLLASTGFGALTGGNIPFPSNGKPNGKSNQKHGGGRGATSTPMTDPSTNISNAGAALNAMKDADKKHLMTVPGLEDEVSGGGVISGSGGDVPSTTDYNRGDSGSLYEEGLRTIMGESGKAENVGKYTELGGNRENDDFINQDGTSHFFGNYEVFVANDGSIHVKKNEWLSKYSAAIHGDFCQVYEYARKNNIGEFERIIDIDLIRTGETIYHLPTVYSNWEGEIIEVQPPKPLVGDEEKSKLTVDAIKKIYFEDVEIETFMKRLIREYRDVINDANKTKKFIDLLKLLLSDNPLSPASLGKLAVSTIYDSIKDITRAYQLKDMYTAFRAYAYCITAWSFENDCSPIPSEGSIKSMENSATIRNLPDIRPHFVETWNTICESTESALERLINNSINDDRDYLEYEEMYQSAFRALANGDEKALSLEIMKGFEEEFHSRMERPGWIAGYPIKYPD